MTEESPSKRRKTVDFIVKIEDSRKHIADSVMTFRFNKKRVKLLSPSNDINKNCKGILYWMVRDARVQDNWAFLYAQRTAIKNKMPLHVCFCILPKFLNMTIRHYKFLLNGLMEVEKECKDLNINFHLLHGEPSTLVPNFVKNHNMGAVVTDFFPLRLPMAWVEGVKNKLPDGVPMCQVDAHNIVPCWIASDKLEYAARTIRSKINSKLDEFLTEFPPVIKHDYSYTKPFANNKWKNALEKVKADASVKEITWAKAGYVGGILELESFLNNRLKLYDSKRNDPSSDAVSNLSPWFHFGMISVQRCILEAMEYKESYEKSVESFMEEAIIRRELSDNFCFYNKNYDTIEGAYAWAIDTLNKHRHDKRQYVYDLHELENSLTHDDLWNACQNQLVQQGKMHGYLRMYWAKKILEWAETPENALEWAIYFNDKYSLDGSDPNGYVGCMWSICGIHDQGFTEREVFGKIRYMNYKGCQRKFDVQKFVSQWAFGTPAWLVSDYRITSAQLDKLGLWSHCFRSLPNPQEADAPTRFFVGCRWVYDPFTKGYNEILGFLLPAFMIATQFFFTLCFLLGLISFGCVLLFALCSTPEQKQYVELIRLIGYMTLVSGISGGIAVIIFACRGNADGWMPGHANNYLGWSFALGVIGSVLMLTASGLFHVEANIQQKKREYLKESQTRFQLESRT
ncbi:hypothetical protein KPH14_004612 [Odynerus spinipes]|uniref:Deoxyribodipyrimidine photo-lyase n=1 Tax=Odynerus spinipes TaxID=1348599 RepID=A0AAD9RM92_9HYME|nr:hypothetical protein KPH14_004612 [Odynerus spinipes]